MSDLSLADIATLLNTRIAELARTLLGQPNPALSSKTQLRFGSKGSVGVEIAGPKRGRWYDHEAGTGGDGLQLIRHQYGYELSGAIAWAERWLGLSPGKPHRPRSSAAAVIQSLGRAHPTAKPEGMAAKVKIIVSGSEDIAGTPAELYLHSRSITARPPDCIRYRPNAFGHHGALVAVATDSDGQVLAVQQIYVTAEGKKAPLEVVKRTNKSCKGWSAKAAVRFHGRDPIVLAEGVETALSIWHATGHETWACLGISNIAHAPVFDGAKVIVARDGDEVGSKADRRLKDAVSTLVGRGVVVAVAEPPTGKDFNDVLLEQGEDAVRTLIERASTWSSSSTDWRTGLLRSRNGEPLPVLANAIHALRQAPEWEGVLWHNQFGTVTVARKPPPWAPPTASWADMTWSDRDDYLVTEWLQHQNIMVPATIAGQAVETVAQDRTFHPLREYLDSLVWDGTARADSWLIRYLGATDTPYTRAVGPRYLTSAIARIYEPGCQADCVLIAEGPQGISKSSALRALGRPWFTDRLSALSSKDAAMETRGVWIIELAELDTMTRSEIGTTKAFISRRHDRFRPPYGKRLVDLPRQCVFAGSVNPLGGYLKDPTGGRRFWPVACGIIDLEALGRDRDQLWAEARDRYKRGDPWWLEDQDLEKLASAEQAERYQVDEWEEPIRTWLMFETDWGTNAYGERRPCRRPRPRPLDDVSVGEVLEQALGIDRSRWNQSDQNRVVACLVKMRFRQCRPRRNGKRGRRYVLDHGEPGPGGGNSD